MRAAYLESKSTSSSMRDLPPPKTKAKLPPVSRTGPPTRGNSKKRKHIGSGSSLSDVEGLSPALADEKSSVAFFSGTNTSSSPCDWRLSYSSSSSSSSGCSSTATVCELEADDGESSVAAAIDNANTVAADPEPRISTSLASVCALDFWSCPNVTLPSAPGRSITRVSSVGSGRGGSFDEASLDCTAPAPFASVLVVSHGGLIAELIGHFAEELGCRLPGGRTAAQQITPNAGLSRFSVTLLPPVDDDELEDPEAWIQSRIECITLHDKDHLANDVEAAPIAVREAF